MNSFPSADVMPQSSRRPRRVLQVIGTMHIGGAENVVLQLVKGLDRERFAVGLCCTKQLGVNAERLRTEAPDAPVVLAASPGQRVGYGLPLRVRREIARFAPDVVHTHGATSLLHVGPLALLGLLPAWVHTYHYGNYDAQGEGKRQSAEGFFSRRATQLVAVSDPQRDSIIRRHRVNPAKITTIVNGVPPNPLVADVAVAARTRAELGFAPDDIVVGTIAVLSEQKGVTYLLHAIRQLVDRGTPAKFLIVGGGPLEGALREEAHALGLDSRITFTGWRQDSAELMTALDIFVMSSLWEAMPMVLLEAMSAKRAILVTDVGDNRRVVDDGRCGLVVPARDASGIARALEHLVSTPGDARALGLAAAERYQAWFSVDRMIAAHEDLYAKLTD